MLNDKVGNRLCIKITAICQQKENFCLSKVSSFFIQAAGLVYHRRTKCGAYHQGRQADLVSHHASACISLRLDEIQHYVLMIYKANAWILIEKVQVAFMPISVRQITVKVKQTCFPNLKLRLKNVVKQKVGYSYCLIQMVLMKIHTRSIVTFAEELDEC